MRRSRLLKVSLLFGTASTRILQPISSGERKFPTLITDLLHAAELQNPMSMILHPSQTSRAVQATCPDPGGLGASRYAPRADKPSTPLRGRCRMRICQLRGLRTGYSQKQVRQVTRSTATRRRTPRPGHWDSPNGCCRGADSRLIERALSQSWIRRGVWVLQRHHSAGQFLDADGSCS